MSRLKATMRHLRSGVCHAARVSLDVLSCSRQLFEDLDMWESSRIVQEALFGASDASQAIEQGEQWRISIQPFSSHVM
jgi:hypothetical protein